MREGGALTHLLLGSEPNEAVRQDVPYCPPYCLAQDMNAIPVHMTVGLLLCCMACNAPHPDESQQRIRCLIDGLTEVSEPGYGYSGGFCGSQFLPLEGTEKVHVFVFGQVASSKSEALIELVRSGVAAVPLLLEHLDDNRPTRIPPVEALMWMSFPDEYDFNRRTRARPPQGVNRDTFSAGDPSRHTITVGDLCFVALGQIVNRRFNAIRYQPTGGLVVSSPTHSARLCSVVRRDFAGLTLQKHKQMLIRDVLKPDGYARALGAYQRLVYYYPDQVEPAMLKLFARPRYDTNEVCRFVRSRLYKEKDAKARAKLLSDFVARHGEAARDGVLVQLFEDLDFQTALEQARARPDLKEKCDARAVLVRLYGFPESVKPTDMPWVDSMSTSDLGSIVEGLVHDKSRILDQKVLELFQQYPEDEQLALECFCRLIDRRYDQEIRGYCQDRMRKTTCEHKKAEFQQVLDSLGKARSRRTS